MIAEPMTKMHVDEYYQLPETMKPMHLIDGEIIEMPTPIPEHQDAAGDVYVWLKNKVKTMGGRAFIAPLAIILDEYNAPEPDVFWIAPDGKAKVEKKRIVGAPDFIAEVSSPSTVRFDKTKKLNLYKKFGVRELWFIDPEARFIEVWALQDGTLQYVAGYAFEDTFTSPLFGAVNAAEIFTT
jgi:Uma2 family endonuclease